MLFLTSLFEVLPPLPEISSEFGVCAGVPLFTAVYGEALLLDGRPAAFFSVVGRSVVLVLVTKGSSEMRTAVAIWLPLLLVCLDSGWGAVRLG